MPPGDGKFDVPMDGNYHTDPSNPMIKVKYLEPWYPPGARQADIIWGSNTAKLALLADGTVLKYVWDSDNRHAEKCLDVEHAILSFLGTHHGLVGYLGRHEHGLRFRFAAHGDVRRYLSSHEPNETSQQVRKKYAKQTAEALAFVHGEGIIHSDVHPNNLLLDMHLDVQFCDFAGSLFGDLDGGAIESVRYFLPRNPLASPDTASDLFALGSTMYFIMSDHEPYNDLSDGEVTVLFTRRVFPDTQM